MSVVMTMEDRGSYRASQAAFPALAKLVEDARTAARLTQEQLAKSAGVSARCVRNIEAGVNTAPQPRTLRRLAAALDLPAGTTRALLDARGPRPARRLAPRPLPVPLSPLVDRTSDVAALSRLIVAPGVRLVSLLGPGGVGKSRLALALAGALHRSFRHHAVFVPLDEAMDHVQAMSAILHSVNVPVNVWEPLPGQVLDALHGRELLMVLDNVEQLPIGTWIVDLLTSLPELRIVTTSRQPLNVGGEHRFEVGPLALPEGRWVQTRENLERAPATALFLQRARCLSGTLDLTDQDLIDIDAICRLAEGYPLRIEQAAALLTTRSLHEIAQRMEDPLTCLCSAPADAPARHQSLEASVRWSYDLLSSDEQWLLRVLGALDGEFTDDVVHLRARIVMGGPATSAGVAQCLRALVEKHLIAHTRGSDGARYALPAHIRMFARAQAALREQSGAARAHG